MRVNFGLLLTLFGLAMLSGAARADPLPYFEAAPLRSSQLPPAYWLPMLVPAPPWGFPVLRLVPIQPEVAVIRLFPSAPVADVYSSTTITAEPTVIVPVPAPVVAKLSEQSSIPQEHMPATVVPPTQGEVVVVKKAKTSSKEKKVAVRAAKQKPRRLCWKDGVVDACAK